MVYLQNNSKIWHNDLVITNYMVDKEFLVYNGKIFKTLRILPLMVGYKIGCFVFTRRLSENIHNSKKYKKK